MRGRCYRLDRIRPLFSDTDSSFLRLRDRESKPYVQVQHVHSQYVEASSSCYTPVDLHASFQFQFQFRRQRLDVRPSPNDSDS